MHQSTILRFLVSALLAGVALAFAGAARAQPQGGAGLGRVTLVVTRGTGAEDCPAGDGFVERVRAITSSGALQTDPRAPTETWVYLGITHDLGRYDALLQTRGRQQGSRALSDVSPNCVSLSEAIAVTLALLLDASAPPTALETKPVLASPTIPAKPALAPEQPHFAAILGGGIAVGLLAQASPWGTAGVDAIVGSRFRLGIGAGLAMPQRVHYLEGYTELGLAWGYARGCAQAARSKSGIELELCVSSMLGVLSGSGERYDFSRTKRWSWLALGGGPEVSGPLASPSFWWLSVVAMAPLTLRGFQITVDGDPRDTFVMSRVGTTASLGMGVLF